MIPRLNTPEYRFAVDKAKDNIEHANECEDELCEAKLCTGTPFLRMLAEGLYDNDTEVMSA